MKRTPLKRKTPLKAKTSLKSGSTLKRSHLNPVSKKRRKEMKTYSSLRKIYLKNHPMCGCCQGEPATDIHHTIGRFKERLNAVEFWIGLCRTCHDHAHRNPEWARNVGLIVDVRNPFQ